MELSFVHHLFLKGSSRRIMNVQREWRHTRGKDGNYYKETLELCPHKERNWLPWKRRTGGGREWIFLLLPLPIHMDFTEGKKDLKEFGYVRPSETQLWHQICGKREICRVKEEVFNSCQGGGQQEILGVLSPQGLACNYFMLCQFVRTGVCFPSRETVSWFSTVWSCS